MTSYFERKTVSSFLRAAILILVAWILFAVTPYVMVVIGVIGAACMLVGAFVIVPAFFLYTMLSDRNYKDKS